MYLLSIVVPTKNRYKFIKSMINKFVNEFGNSEQIELVIQDNSDNNSEILDFLQNNTVNNVRYCYDNDDYSVSENFSLGIKNSNGEYISMFGDDDGFSSYILKTAQYMKNNDIDSAIFNKAHYKWPDALLAMPKRKLFELKMHGLAIHKSTGKVVFIDCANELQKQMNVGFVVLGKMPEVYHGIVRKRCFDKILSDCNSYFPGASPDMANAVALCYYSKKHVYIDAPITFSGQCKISAGGANIRKQHVDEIKNVSFLPKDIESKWDSRIPKIWTVQTIYAETACEIFNCLGKNENTNNINWCYLYADFLANHPEYKKLCLDCMSQSTISMIKFYFYLLKIKTKKLGRFPMFLIRKITRPNMNINFDGVSDTLEASRIIDEYIESLDCDFLK